MKKAAHVRGVGRASDKPGFSTLCKLGFSGAPVVAAVSGPLQQTSTLSIPVALTSTRWSPLLHAFVALPVASATPAKAATVSGIRGIDAKAALRVLQGARRLVAKGYVRSGLGCDKNGRTEDEFVAWSLAGAIQNAGDAQAICFHLRHAVARVAGCPHLTAVENNPLFGKKDALALIDKTLGILLGLTKEPRRRGPAIGDKPSAKRVESIRAELVRKRAAYMEKLAGGVR